MVASREKAEIEADLNALNPGDDIPGSRGLLWQVLGDADLTHDHRITFVERDRVALVVPAPPESLGFSSTMGSDDSELDELLKNAGMTVPITRSDVPVRP